MTARERIENYRNGTQQSSGLTARERIENYRQENGLSAEPAAAETVQTAAEPVQASSAAAKAQPLHSAINAAAPGSFGGRLESSAARLRQELQPAAQRRGREQIQAELDSNAKEMQAVADGIKAMEGTLRRTQGSYGRVRDAYTADRLLQQQTEQQATLDESRRQLDELTAKRAQLERELQDAKYNEWLGLMQQPDFAEKSRYKSTENGQERKFSPVTGTYTGTGFDDIYYDYINGNQTAQDMTLLADTAQGTSHEGWRGLPENVVSLFNYIYATQGRDKAYAFLDEAAQRAYTGLEAAALSFASGTGALSLGAALGSIGGGESAKRTADVYKQLTRETQESAAQHPGLARAGSITGNIALMYGIGAGAGTIAAKAGLPYIAGRTAVGALSFGGANAIQNAGAVSTGQMSIEDYLEGVGIGLAAGGIGGAAGAFASSEVAMLLEKYGLMTSFGEFVRQMSGGVTESSVNTATEYVLRGEAPTKEELFETLIMTFAFSLLTSATRTLETTAAQKANMEEAVRVLDEGYARLLNDANGMTPEGVAQQAGRILNQIESTRSTLKGTYIAGQQESVNNIYAALDILEDAMKGYLNGYAGSSYAPGGVTGGSGGYGMTVRPAQNGAGGAQGASGPQTGTNIAAAAGAAQRSSGGTQNGSNIAPATQAPAAAVSPGQQNAAPGAGAASAGGIQANPGAGNALRESTNVNDNPAQHTEAEQRVIEEYKNSVDPGLVEFYEAAKEQSTAKKGAQPYMLKPVSDRLAGAIEQLTGVNTSGFDTRLDVRQANHIYTDHGENGKADRTMADASDVGRLQYVIDNYDSIVPWGSTAAYWQPNGRGGNKQAKTVLLSKKVNGTYYVVEAAPDTAAKSVYVVSAYMLEQGKTPPGNANKIATGEIEQPNDAEMPRRNGQTATTLDNPVANSTIPQPSPAVNTLENTRDGENGWGTRYNSAAEALEAGMRELAPSLWREYSGAEYTPQRDAIVAAVMRVGQDVGRGTVSPAKALRYLERAYKGGGIEAIERIASTPGEKYAPRAGETVTLPTAEQELAERNGGNLNGQKRTETDTGGQERTGDGNALPDRSAGRDAGERAGGKADGMEARKGGRADAGRKAIERQNRGRRLPLERVTSRELGLKQGTENPNLKLLPEDAWDDGLRQTAERLEQETGRSVTYVLGGMEIEDADGETHTVRGVITQEQIIIQADCMSATAEQIGEHELFHYYADTNPGLISSVREEITEKYGREEFDEIVGKYIERLRGIIDASESPFADAQDAVLEDIENEIFADAYAGINAFGAHAERYHGEVRAVTERRGVTTRQTREATERRTGPPAGEDEYLQLLREQLRSGEITDSEYDRLFDEYYQGGSEGRYSFGGEKARGADLEALKRAKEMTRLTEALSDPVLSFEAGDKIGVLTKDIDGDGKPLLVGVLKNTELDGEIVNRIKSAYGLDDPQAWIKNQIAEGKTLRIYDNEKADSFLGEFGYKAERPKDYRSGDTIPNVHENVKYSAFNEEVARQLAGEAPGKTKFSAEDEGGGRGEHSTGGPGIRFSVSDEEGGTGREAQERGADAESVRTALPKKAQNYLRSTERTLVNRIGNALGVPKLARREYLDAIVQEISSEYLRSGRVSAESANRLFDRAYDEGIVVDEEFYRQYKDLKDRLRTMRVSISEKDRADIDDFNSFRRSAFGTLNIANDGTPVDVAYQELNADAPELFPPEITHPADQLMRMFDAARSIQRTEKSLDEYYGHSAAEFRRWAKNDFDAAISDTLSELRNIKRYADEGARAKAEEPPATLEEVKEAYKQLREARKKYEKAMAKNLLTHDDEMQVGLLMRGETELQYISPRKYNVRGIRAVYEAKAEYEKYAGAIRKWNESRRAELKKIADTLLETANSWKDKRAGILYSRETMERNIRDIVKDKELADRIIAEYFTPVHKAQAESTRLKNRMRRKVDALKLSTIETKAMKRDGRVSEAHAVQLFGEAMDNIQMLENSRGRIKTRDGKTLEEWRAAVTDLWTQNPQLDRAKIENAVEEFRKIYDELFAMMNESRLRNGYEPVNYRRGYFPHFQPGDGDGVMGMFGRALGIETQVTALPTTINGLTHTFRPGIQWFGNALERRGFETAYDAVEGFDRYIEGVADVIYQTDNIQKLRALATQVRYRTGDEGIKKQVDAVNADTTLSEEDRQSRIDKIYEDGRFALSNFAVELEEYTNLLANKKSRADRSMEQALGRRMYNIVKTLEGRVAANMVSVNIGSWLTNYIPLTQGWATLGRGELLRGMWQTLKNMKESDGIVDASTFLTNRRGSDPLVRSWSQRASATLSSPMEHIDQFTAGSLVRARYNQNLKRGMSESAAMDEADSWAAGVMADRSKGSTPTLFNRRNPITKLFTQFQLEVNNQLSYVFKDIPGEMKDKGLAALALALLKFCLGAWLYDEIYEYFVGRRPALDPIGILNDTVGDITGYELPNLVTLGVGAVTGDVPSFETEKAGVGDTLKNLGGNIAEQVPFVGGLMGGGRIPVSSALPDLGKLYDAATSDTWSMKKRLSTAGKEFSKPATYLVPPFGGGQIRKIYQGLKAVIEGGSYTVDNEGNEQLQYPVYTDTASDTVKSIVQSTLFGKTALPGGREWIGSGFKSLNAKQTAVYQGMLDVGVSQREAYRTVREISALKKTDTESAATVQRNYLDNSNLSGEGKSVVYYGLIASDKERETMDALADMGADMGAVTQALMDMKDEKKDADKLVVIADANFSGEEALALAGMVMGTELTNDNGSATQYAKLKACIDAGMDASDAIAAKAAGADLEKLLEFSDAGLDSDTALKAAGAIAALEPEEGKKSVSDVQKWRAAVDAGGTTEEQMNALKAVMREEQYTKLEIALSYGIEPESYVHLKELLPQYDKDGSGGISNEELEKAIDTMGGGLLPGVGQLTREQQAVLWQLFSGSKSAKNNPYSRTVGQKILDAREKGKEKDLSALMG